MTDLSIVSCIESRVRSRVLAVSNRDGVGVVDVVGRALLLIPGPQAVMSPAKSVTQSRPAEVIPRREVGTPQAPRRLMRPSGLLRDLVTI